MEKVFDITAADMATLLLLNTAVADVVEEGTVTPDILEELELLQPSLEQIIFKEESPLHHAG